MKAKKKIIWNCGGCGEEWDEEQEAIDCCRPEFPDSEEVWVCSECDEEFETRKEANECCANQTLSSFKK